jgi:hypothetical protein
MDDKDSVPFRGSNFYFRHRAETGSRAHLAFCAVMITGGPFEGSKDTEIQKLFTHFHVVPRISMRGARLTFPSALISTGMTLRY